MLRAVEHVRPMRGGAQSHLIRADDGHCYVVKALNNPQHPRILANEWLASGIARALKLSVPPFAAIELPQDFIAAHPGLVMRFGGRTVPVAPGPAFGSRVPTSRTHAPVYDYLPEPGLEQVENLAEFAGALALDKWVCNCDGRQVIYCRPTPRAKLKVWFIDQGFAFNAGDWTFPDSKLRGLYCRNLVYRDVRGWESFEPWLFRIEDFDPNRLLAIADAMPEAWRTSAADLERLIATLVARRQLVRGLLEAVRRADRAPFENWGKPLPVPLINPQPVMEGAHA